MKKELQLTSGSVLLRPYRITDVDAMYEAVRESIAEISPWMWWCHPDYSKQETRTWIESQTEKWEKGNSYNFAIIDSESNEFLGGCGLDNKDKPLRIAELGYWVRTSRTKQNVATTAVLLLAWFGFDELKLNRIEIAIAVDNIASQRVAEKMGAVREGILRNRLIIDGSPSDAVVFSLIPGDIY